MNTFKKTILALAFTLAFFASDALANCTGKTIYLEVPSDWPQNAVYYYVVNMNTIANANITKSGNWFIFTFPNNFEHDDNNQTFAFVKSRDSLDYQSVWISLAGYNQNRNSRPNNADKFSCNENNFSSEGVLYIYEDPTNPGKTVTSTEPPNAYYFYFLPPNETEWIINIPHLALLKDGDTTLIKMQMDPTRCGWYRLIYFNEDPPSSPVVIYSNGDRTPKDKVGLLGVDEDYSEWVGGPGPGKGHPTTFNLMARFNDLNTRELYFTAQKGSAGWTATDPNIYESWRCQFNLATVIYMHALGGSFSQYPNSGACGDGTYYSAGYVQPIRGIVQNTLDENGRMVIDSSMIGNSSGWCTADQFNDAFKFTEGYNIEVCYDMPFERVVSGNWEFDSDRMTNPAGLQVGGFFPHVVYSPYLDAGGRGMDECPNCLVNHQIDASPTITTQNSSSSVAPVTWRGETYTDIDAFNRTDAASFPQGSFSYNYGNRVTGRGDGYVRPLNATWTNEGRNHICVESHAEFTYNGGEEFFFRGDDDIWIFINNRLVIDLGGNHEALPGYVDLDTIGGCTYTTEGGAELSGYCSRPDEKLEKGNKYNIDIFFCDRRGTNQSARISTNIYFGGTQKYGLYLNGIVGNGAEVCMESSGGNYCGSNNTTINECGSDVADKVEYYITNRGGTQTYILNDQTCERNGDILSCYGGININTVEGTVQINTDNITGLTGTYIIYVKFKDEYAAVMNPMPSPLELCRFSISGKPSIPYPTLAEIYDANGDGIGDSLRITYSGIFPRKDGILDSLPNYIEIFWDLSIDSDSTIGFGLGKKEITSRYYYNSEGFTQQENYDFWTTGNMKIEQDSIIVIYGVNFSKDIITAADSSNIIRSWATYTMDDDGTAIANFDAIIVDRIDMSSPIKENRYANPQISFSLQPLIGNYFQISIANFENMHNAKIDVYNLKGDLVNSIAVSSSQMQIKVPASGFYIFNLNGPGISPKTTIGVAR